MYAAGKEAAIVIAHFVTHTWTVRSFIELKKKFAEKWTKVKNIIINYKKKHFS